MSKKYPKNNDLFGDENVDKELFYQINESDVQFPLFFKNKDCTIYTRYNDEEKFEQITVSKETESFRGSLIFGFNTITKEQKIDLKTWYYVVFRNQVQIEAEEYERVFDKLFKGREEFFTSDTHKYIEPVLNWGNQKPNHKWKPL